MASNAPAFGVPGGRADIKLVFTKNAQGFVELNFSVTSGAFHRAHKVVKNNASCEYFDLVNDEVSIYVGLISSHNHSSVLLHSLEAIIEGKYIDISRVDLKKQV